MTNGVEKSSRMSYTRNTRMSITNSIHMSCFFVQPFGLSLQTPKGSARLSIANPPNPRRCQWSSYCTSGRGSKARTENGGLGCMRGLPNSDSCYSVAYRLMVMNGQSRSMRSSQTQNVIGSRHSNASNSLPKPTKYLLHTHSTTVHHTCVDVHHLLRLPPGECRFPS